MVTLGRKWFILVCSVVCLTLSLAACSPKPKIRKQQSKLDDPSHHVLRGQDMIRENRWTEARREFRLALELNPKYPAALAGKALVIANESTLPGKSDEERENLRDEAKDLLDQAESNAEGDRQDGQVELMALRVVTMLKSDEDWLEDAEDHFANAAELFEENINLQRLRSEPYYYMGIAYREALELGKASEQFRKVLELNLSFTKEANEALELLDKILRAEPGTRHGKVIAMSPSITRGDMAALLIEEFHLDRLYKRDAPAAQYDKSFKPPNPEFVPPQERLREVPVASDIEKHPLRIDIEAVIDLKVRGLEVSPQHLFYPDQTITRAEFALMLEDILIQVTRDRSLATRFIGDSSPWPDVREDAFYYNAARTLVSRNIMTVESRTRGEFGPQNPVHGADALLGLRILKDELDNYVRKPQS